MTERFDAVVMGMGPAGEVAASRLLSQGLRVAVIERELIGGGVRALGVHPEQDIACSDHPRLAPGHDAQPASRNPNRTGRRSPHTATS